jgi:hypothetical protein
MLEARGFSPWHNGRHATTGDTSMSDSHLPHHSRIGAGLCRAVVLLGVGAACSYAVLAAQQAWQPSERAVKMSADATAKGLAEPFRGITADGTVQPGLFAIRSTGVSTAPVREAAQAFVASLTPDQRARTTFPVDADEWRMWMNQHFYVRQGVRFGEMADAQRDAALGLLRASLSARGLTLSQDVMRLNHTLGELNDDNFQEYGEGLYWITVMGEPSDTEPWGWQLDGHHLIINYFVLGDQVVMTPAFFGSEPVVASSGKYAGTRILEEEQAQGLALVNALTAEQQKTAILSADKTRNNNQTEAWRDNAVVEYAGLRASDMTAEQRERLTTLIGLYVGAMRDVHATVRMEEVQAHLDATRFAWVGGTGPTDVFYYRIHSPVILIEFDHQTPVAMRHLVDDPRAPFRDHIHTVTRTPNGNDYGKDLLRQHYERQRRNAEHGHVEPAWAGLW